MKDSLYIKLEDHSTYEETMRDINDLLDDLDDQMETLRRIKQKEAQYIDNWEEKAEEIRKKVAETGEILDTNS
jgi:vacuolar-type H+-ATPase subunit I/STV1